MLTEICAYLKNYFETERRIGTIQITGGEIYCDGVKVELEDGQHFALFRDRFVLGVYEKGDEIPDKTFTGAVWPMDIPEAIIQADQWAEAWKQKNGAATSDANGPFQSESFGGYSYSKAAGGGAGVGSSVFDQAQFKAMLAPYKKIRL